MPASSQHQQFILWVAVSDILHQIYIFLEHCQRAGVQEYPIFVNRLILLDFILWKNVYDLKGSCTCKACLRELVCKMTWIATVLARSIKSCPVLTRYQSCVVLCSSFMLSKGVSHELFVLASYYTPALFISWGSLVSLNPTFCAYENIQCRCNIDGILILYHFVSVPQFLQQETVPILVGAYKETH